MAPSILTNKFSLHVKTWKRNHVMKHNCPSFWFYFSNLIAKEYHITLPKACLAKMLSLTVSGLLH